jgi:hypothetical protein
MKRLDIHSIIHYMHMDIAQWTTAKARQLNTDATCDMETPMLCVLAMVTLNRLLNKARDVGVLQPLGISSILHSCSLYADAVILLAAPSAGQA